MKCQFTAESSALFSSAMAAIAGAGGFKLVEEAEADPARRRDIGEMLDALGVADIGRIESLDQAEAAVMLCRAAGRFALPYPVAEVLAAGRPGEAVTVVSGAEPLVSMADLDLAWTACNGFGEAAAITAVHPLGDTKLGRFVAAVELGPWRRDSGSGDLLYILLQSWCLIGFLEAAAEHTYLYLNQRRQFGRLLSQFQSLRFQATDMSMAIAGATEMGKYSLWSAVEQEQATARTDALAFRIAALESARIVLSGAHQLHGAVGFCDEVPLSWLSRYSQPLRRLPWSEDETETHLLTAVEQNGFDGLFGRDLSRGAG